MPKKQPNPDIGKHVSVMSSIEEVFQDNYEYEEYFEISNNLCVSENCPSDIDIEITAKVKKVRLRRPRTPNEKDLLLVLVPSNGKKYSFKQREAIREKYLKKYCSLVDKVRLDMRDEFAVRRKLLINDSEKKVINARVRKKRNAGYKKIKYKMDKPI